MAYVFGFNKDITDIIYSFRDWKLEEVKRKEGTPSCLALKPYKIMKKMQIHVHTLFASSYETWTMITFIC